ncbi:MAG: PKD domain-containing protein [Bacteroidota bacterium]
MNKKLTLFVILVLTYSTKILGQCYSLPSYCTPTFTNINNYGIGLQNVTLGSTINNSTTATGLAPNYFDYTNLSFSASAGGTVSFSIQNGSGNTTGARIFIDYNQDGTYSTSSPELVWTSSTTTPSAVVTGTFTVPSGQALGAYRVRVTGDLGGQTANPCALGFGEVEDYNMVITSSTNDAQVMLNTLPVKYVVGTNTISFTMANLTNSSMSSVDIGYKLGSNTPVTQSLSGLSVAAGGVYTATFSTGLTISSTGTYNIKIWLGNVNGSSAATPANDTLCRTFVVCSGLSGNYTIDPAGSGSSNFKRFGEADTALINCGVSGKVVFKVATGVYKEKIILPATILGTSAANSVTFESASGTASDVNLTDSSIVTSANYTLSLNGVSYIKFKNMTITARGVNFGTALFINPNSHYDSFFNVVFNSSVTTTTSTNNAVIQSPSQTIGNVYHYLYFGNCKINNGSYGTYLQSYSSGPVGASSQNLTFFKCEFTNQYYMGMYHQYFDGLKLINNKITTNSAYTAYYGIYNNYIMMLDDTKKILITGNTITGAVGGHGIYNQSIGANSTITPVRRALIANNMIQLGSGANSAYGMRFSTDYGSDILHNSVNIGTTLNTNTSAAVFFESIGANTGAIYNNIFAGYNGAPAIRINTASNVVPCNYNDLYTTGTNLAYLNTTGYTTIAAWRTASTKDLNSVNVSPGFTSNTDLHTTAAANLINVTVDPLVIVDYDGQTRCGTTDIGVDHHPSNNDIGVSRTLHPNGNIAGAGTRDVIVVIRNFGNNVVTSANVGYTDGSTTQTIAWTGSLNPCDSAVITFTGSKQYTFSGSTWALKFFTDGPNGTSDANIPNDTLRKTGCVGLFGNYTINPSGSGSTNFTSFTNAINAMTSCGIASPVVFTVAAATYNEQISIPAISGTSATNTITFDGGNGNAASRILSYSSTSSGSPHVLRFNACNYITFRNMTIQSPSTTDAWVVHFLNGTNNRVNNCVIEVSGSGATATASNLIPIVINGNATSLSTTTTVANNHTIDSCKVNAGYYGLYITVNATNNIINVNRNIFSQAYQYGTYSINPFSLRFRDNSVTLRTTVTSSIPCYFQSVNNTGASYFEVSGNKILNPGQMGLYFNSCANSGSAFNTVFNNMIGGNFRYAPGAYGIYLTSCSRTQVYHNSINLDIATTGTSAAVYVANGTLNDVRNNHLAITNPASITAYNLYITPSTAVSNVDYNNYFNRSTSSLVYIGGPAYETYNYKAAYPNGGGLNSINLNPEFASTSDLHSSGPCNNAASVGITTDIDGQTRSTLADIGADEVTGIPNNDIGVSEILSPSFPFTSGTHTIKAVIKNYGANAVTSANVNYIINGGSTVTQSWSGSLSTCDTAHVIFTSTYSFSTGSSYAEVFTSSPNGSSDTKVSNDSVRMNLCTAMSGSYTINPSGSGSTNFTSFKNAVDAMACGGIAGPIRFAVAAATYNEQVSVPPIKGSSATNTIIFDGGAGNASTRIVTFSTTTTALCVVQLRACSYVTFRNLTMRSTGTTAGWVANFMDGTNNRISNCVIEITGSGATYTGSNLNTVVVNGSPTTISTQSFFSDNNMIDSNVINTGYYNIYVAMSSVANKLFIKDNILNNSYQYSIFSGGNYSPKITGNTLNLRTAITTNFGIYIQNCNNTQGNSIEINGNKIINTGQYGIYLTSCTKSGTDYNLVANNMVGNFRHNLNSAGIYMTSASRTRVFHNSIDLNSAMLATGTTNAALFVQNGSANEIRNNHLVVSNPLSQNTYPVWITPATAVATLDNNNYYNTSSPFLINIANVLNAFKTYTNTYPNGGGSGSINLDPFFVSTTDLHSTNTCNAGSDLTAFVPNDIDGSSRSTTPDIGADEVTTSANNDIGVLKINGPVAPLVAGTGTVNVTLKNYGGNTVTSATVIYRMNGGTAVSQSWSGSLAPCDTVNFVFSTTTTVASGANSLMVYTSNPNSSTDAVQKNDTARYNLCGSLSGTYTIGGGKDFTNFTAAVNALNCGGVSGKVIFKVDAGSYYEQLFISDLIKGVSANSTVTFQSASGSAVDVSLTYSGTAVKNYTLQLFNANYFKFKDMTINAINTTTGTAVAINYNSSYDSFVNVIFNGISTTTNSTNLAVVSSPAGISSFIYFGDCQFNNGAYGSYFNSNANATSSENLTFYNCTFTNQYVYGIFNQNLNGIRLIKNKVVTNSTLTTYTGIYNNAIAIIADANRPLIIGNRIWGATAGTGLNIIGMGINSTATLARRPIVANNMIQIGSSGSATIGLRENNSVIPSYYLHNSINNGGTSTASTSAAAYFESSVAGNVILNNSFVAYASGPAIRVNTPTNYRSNYNNLFTNGATLGYQAATARATLAVWKTNTVTLDSNSVNVNPIYTSNNDLHSNQSLMDNAGTPTSFVVDDYDGTSRCPNGGCPGTTSNPDIGADEFLPSALDVAVVSINGPTLICPNTVSYSVTTTIKNLGSTTLTSATINWSVNGVTQTPFSWTGSLVQNTSSASITIGTYLFGGGTSRVRVWTTAPNGSADQNTMNDTANFIPPSTFKGIYTIGGSSPDFYNVADAVTALNLRGVCGPVTFNIRPGTYGGRIQLNAITGSSAVNFITFRPDPANTQPVELTVDGNSVAADNHTIFLNGTSFVAFRDMKITNSSIGTGGFGSVIRFAGAQDSVLFIKNIITGPVTTNTSTNFAVFNHGTGSGNMINRCVVDSNTISNGSYGIYLYGNTTTNASTLEFRNRIRHNQITGAYYRGIDIEFQRRSDIIGNKIWLSPNSQTGSSGIYLDYVDSFKMERNNINNFGQYGIYLQRANYQFGGGSFRSTLQNNMIGGRSTQANPYGVYMSTSTPGIHNMDIFHNSISVTSGNTGSAFFLQQTTANTYSNLDIRNNSFANFGLGTYTCYFYCNPVISGLTIDYNNYYTASTNNLIFVIGNSGYTAATGGAPTYNSNSISGNPGYANNSNNLHAVKPQLNNKGTFINTCAIDIDGQSRPLAPSTIVDIGADEFYPPFIDIGVSQLNPPDICTNNQALSVRVGNFSTKTIDSFRLNWMVNGALQTPMYINNTITAGNSVNVTVNSSFNFVNNTTYNFRFWTYKPIGLTDSVPDNDTLTTTFNFLGNAPAPTVFDVSQCGMGKPFLSGLPPTSSDSLSWYTAATGGTYLGMGNNITGPFINQTTTFYGQSIRLSKPVRFGPVGNTAVNVNQTVPYGGMLNVTISKTVLLDSMLFKLWYNVPNTGYNLYYKTGTFNGFETNSSAWTLVNSGQVTYFNQGGFNWGRVSTKGMFLQAGQTYSFYFASQVNPNYPTGNVIYCQNGGPTVANTEMSIQGGGSIIIGSFGATQVLANWHPEMTFVYKNMCQGGTRSPLKVTVKKLPSADVVKGTPFQGQFNTGIVAQPDVLEVGKTNTYELVAPVGYTNAGHGTTWAVTNIVAKTAYGVIVPLTEYDTVVPSASGPGKLIFKPTSAFLDSLITFSVSLSDFGPNNCDSIVKRTVMVAPTPKTNFKFNDTICLGEISNFENLTTIHSGNATYKWYFGTSKNDSSDLQNAEFTYPAPGTYFVKLVATSTPWGVVKDTTLKVFITDIPTVKFKVLNQCEGLPIQFQNQSFVSGSGVMKFKWDFGDNTAQSTATHPSHLYTVPAGYKVTLNIDFNGCKVALTKNAYQFPRPKPNFTVPAASVCTKTDITFDNTSTIAWGNQGAYWTFGDGDSYTTLDAQHAYAAPGSYSVKLLAVSEFNCKDSITKVVTIKASPKPDFTANQYCSRTPTIFNNLTVETVANPVYTWTVSDGYTTGIKNMVHGWANEGVHSVTLKAAFTNGCSESITKDINVVIQPKADFTVTDICSGETANFVNLSTGDKAGMTFNWDFGNGSGTDRAPRRLYNPATTTIYTVQLVAAYPGGCTDTMRKILNVNEQPTCDFTIKNLGFMNTQFTPANTSYLKYEWLFGDGGISSAVSPSYQFTTKGIYDVILIAESGSGCKCTMTKRMSANTDVKTIADNGHITLYPNPNNGVFTITSDMTSGMKIDVYSVTGSLVQSNETADNTSIVDLGDVANGIYIVKVTINGSTNTFRISVVK